MLYARAARLAAVGVLLVLVSVCGSGEESGDDAATGQSVQLPAVEKATQKRLPAENIA
jgi:hypothetical protein